MSELKGHFGGVVESANADSVFVRVDTICQLGLVDKGVLVAVSRENFAKGPDGKTPAMPCPGKGRHVEGNVERTTPTAPNRYTNLTAIV